MSTTALNRTTLRSAEFAPSAAKGFGLATICLTPGSAQPADNTATSARIDPDLRRFANILFGPDAYLRSDQGRISAIQRNRGAGEEIGSGAGQEYCDSAEVIDAAPPTRRRAGKDALVQALDLFTGL